MPLNSPHHQQERIKRRLSLLMLAGLLLGCSSTPAAQPPPATLDTPQPPPAPLKPNQGRVSTRLVSNDDLGAKMAVAPTGDVYLATLDAIVKLAKDGSQSVVTPLDNSAEPDAAKRITGVEAIELDKRGVLYVATNRYLYRVFADGRVEVIQGVDFEKYREAGSGRITIRGMAFDRTGNVFLASESSNTIHKVTPDGAESVYAGRTIRSDEAGEPYRDGSRETALFHAPRDIVVDAHDNLFVADTQNRAIRQISPDGIVSTFWRQGDPSPPENITVGAPSPDAGSPADNFSYTALAIDRLGNLYATCSDNRIRKLTPEGHAVELAGDGTRCQYPTCTGPCASSSPQDCYADGPGPSARFDLPRGIGVDDQGVVHVMDGATELRIRTIE